ncbi:hypothetical protein H8K36_09750 [Undibacterium sp. LX22W]|uniref:Uncharacterized protein n=1 Tax=Undibacterium nitidum TaxID=2762298 RepID=A0A923KLB2_9BURK|nr:MULTISPECIES: hypothetical protein [Undibacterium]MBC3881655.1 hypothetical protein [Undibacterium nitidum]
MLLFLALVVANSHACKPAKEAYDLTAFLSLNQPNVLILEAKVLKVQELKQADGLIEQSVTLRVEKNLLGASNEIVVVKAFYGGMVGTSCERTFDVEMHEGERWLVVALPVDGNAVVRPMLSQRFTIGVDLRPKLQMIENYVREMKFVENK